MIFRDLIALVASFTDEHSAGITKVGSITDSLIYENNKSTASAVVSFFFPLFFSLNERFSERVGDILFPIFLLEEALV